MTDTPPDWVLIEAAKRGGYHWPMLIVEQLREYYVDGERDDLFRALCDMILKHEQPPVDRKLLCAREAMRQAYSADTCVEWTPEQECVRAIELYESGFGK